MSDVALRFGATDEGLTAKFRQVDKQLDDFEKSAGRVSSAVSSGFSKLAGIVGAISLVRLTQEALEFAESLDVASARTGIAVENLQRLQFVASQSNVSVDAITSAINKLQKELVTGGQESSAAINRLGLSIGDLRTLAPDDQFLKIAEAIAEIPDPAERSSAAMQIFGRGGAELLPVLTQGAEGVRALSAQFDKLGVSVSAEAVGKVDDLGDAFGRMKVATKALTTELLALVAVPITGVLDATVTFLKAIRFGLSGGDEAERLNTRILELQGRVSLFEKDQTQSGQERLKQAKAELELLERKQQILLGVGEFGSFGAPTLEQPGVPQVKIPSIRFGDTLGPKEPTAAERRAQAESGPSAVDIKIDEDRLLEDQNQKHLDELLRQTTEYVAEKVHIESDAEQFLADVRRTFGLEQIEFEKTKNTSMVEIGSMLFTSLAAQNSKLAKIQQAIAIAQTIWATATGIAKAVASFNYAAAAKIAIVGAIQLAKIRATNYSASGVSGGSAPSVSGGDSISSADTSAQDAGPQGAQERPQANITIYSTGWSREAIESFVDAARETFDQYDVTLFGSNSLQAQIIRQG